LGYVLLGAMVLVGLATAAFPTWIETVVHSDPDGGDGTLEAGLALLVIVVAVATVVTVVVRGLNRRRTRRATSTRVQG
jgi:hypothetical protein